MNSRQKASAFTHLRYRLKTGFHVTPPQVTPRAAGPGDPMHRFRKQPRISPGATGITFPAKAVWVACRSMADGSRLPSQGLRQIKAHPHAAA